MENHPIPQDITGFQFKLIGNMTVKQFAFLAAGIILAWISFILPISFLIKLPLIILFASLGVSFAFVPIDGRSMDTMFINLIKALFTPTQFLYQKQGGDLLKQTYSPLQQNGVIGISQNQPPEPVPLSQPMAPASTPTNENIKENEELLEEQEDVLSEEIKETQEQNPNDQKLLELQAMLNETIKQKQELENELQGLKAMLEKQTEEKSIPIPQPKEVKRESRPDAHIQGEIISHPEPPNLLKGVVKDPRGNPLLGILVEVVDQEENPVRAFKTNDKGEFTSATSLGNGKYLIKLEDPKAEHKFDNISFEATGAPLPLFEVKSIDQREELRRELFN